MGLLAAGVVIGALFAPPDPEAVQKALDRVLHERAYQTELPGPDGRFVHQSFDEHPRDARGRHRTGRTAGRRDPGDPSDDEASGSRAPSGASAVASALFYVVIGVLVVLFLVWLATEFRGRERRGRTKAVGPTLPGAAPAGLAVVPLDEVDALAAAGRFAEAVHLLLLRTIAALPRAAAVPSPALTSRELLDASTFRPGARDAMAGLVDAVEVSLFGGRPVPEAAYRECRARFDRFVAVQTGGAA